jgi:uncharacterized protein (UPF0305 family)
MIMDDGKLVLCASSKYEQKYYLNPAFDRLPDAIKDELKIMCVLFTEDIGGILSLEYDEDGHLQFVTVADEEDILYDEIGCALKIKQYQQTKRELLESLELFYRVFIKGEPIDDVEED